MAEPTFRVAGYDVGDYSGMVADPGRSGPYVSALTQLVKPGAIVLDIGAGTAFFSLLACRLGARKTYAIEPANAIEVGRQLAAANGCADRIDFIQDLSTRIRLPEPADVIVSDLRGVLPLFQRHLTSILDARRRHLASGGALIPRLDRLWCAPVELPDAYQRHLGLPDGYAYGFDWRPALRLSVNTWCRVSAKPEALIAPPMPWVVLNYTTLEETNASGAMSWIIQRAGAMHGLLVWFDTELAEGIGFSNAPGQPELIYGQAFFPLTQPVHVLPGDDVTAELAADLVGEDYIWRWNTRVTGADGTERAAFRQSTFFGAPLSAVQLRNRRSSFAPALNHEGQLKRAAFELMDGTRALSAIASILAEGFPAELPTRQKALAFVADLSQRYGQ